MAAKAGKRTSKDEASSALADLFAALDDGSLSAVQQILEQPGLTVNSTNKHGESPLHVASGSGHLELVRWLNEKGAFIDVKDKHGDTPLYWAARHGHLAIVQFLCQKGAAINVQDRSGETAVHVSCRYGYTDVVEYLCTVGASLDIQDHDGETPLHCACWHGFYDIVRCLCTARVSMDRENKDNETPLHIASVRGYLDIVRCLCEAGCQTDVQDKHGCPAVHLAVRRQHLDIVQYLVNHGASLDIQDKHGETGIHDACRDGHLPIVHTLYAGGCDLNIPNKHGVTPLQLASKNGHFEVVRCLVVGGCDLYAVNHAGQTAADIAMKDGHPEIANLLIRVKQGNMQSYLIDQLAINSAPLRKVKLYVCGHAAVGKTTLIGALKCTLFKSLFTWKAPPENLQDISRRTHGIRIEEAVIPRAGLFTIWDLSGSKSYYPSHETFLGDSNTVYLITFSLRDLPEKQQNEVLLWLALIKAKLPQDDILRSRGTSLHCPNIILIATRGDAGSAKRDPVSGFLVSSEADEVLQKVQADFGHYFNICKRVFVVDARHPQSRDMKALRVYLGQVRELVIKNGPRTPKLCNTIAAHLPTWRHAHEEFPVLPWNQYLAEVERDLNPLVGSEKLKVVTQFLNDTGDLIYVNRGAVSNLVIIDPHFVGSDMLGPGFAPEGTTRPHIRTMTGRVPLREVSRVYPGINPLSIMRLFEHFNMCRECPDQENHFEFPVLMQFDKLHGLWEPEAEFPAYIGLRVQCRSPQDIFTPGFFPKLQLRLRQQFCDDFDDQELTLWSEGLKCVRGDAEIKLELASDGRSVSLIVRGSSEARRECVAHLQRFHQVLQSMLELSCPGTYVTTQVLSVHEMKAHRPEAWYEPEQIFQAQRGTGIVHHRLGFTEKLTDLLCCGCPEMLLAAKSAPLVHIKSLDTKTRRELSRLLDPPDPLGRDWCLLALSLGLMDELPVIDMRQGLMGSATDRVLREFERRSSSTVTILVDALREIGRHDAVQALVSGLPLAFKMDNDVVVNVKGVEMTSYAC